VKTIALRFGEHFAPECGTIEAHRAVIEQYGYVWYGKLGAPVSSKVISEICDNEKPKILLINSGKADRYWAHVVEISKDIMSKCRVASSGAVLGEVSKHSMSPYFIIEVE